MEWITGDNRARAKVDGLGVIEIYPASGGYAVAINDRRAWSECVGTLKQTKARIEGKVFDWAYLNGFKA